MKVLVVGSITRDTIVQARPEGDHVTRTVGGTAFYATSAYARLGATVSVVTCLAPADESWVRAQLPPQVTLHVQASVVTTSFENRYFGDRRSQRVGPLAPPIAFAPGLAGDADWVHLGPLHPQDLDTAWYDTSASALALDLQGLVRRVVGDRIAALATPELASRLMKIRWLKAGVEEWQVALAALGVTEDACVARHPELEVLRTEGKRGGALLRAAVPTVSWPPLPLVEHGDPTGAGDVFFAAYLFRRAGRGDSARESTHAAARCVSDFLRRRVG